MEVELRAILTLTYEDLALFKQREEMGRETLRVARAHLGEEHPAVADALHQIGDARSRLGDQAESVLREELAKRRKLRGNEHPDVAFALNDLAVFLRDLQKLPEAEAVDREELAMERKLSGDDHPSVANSLAELTRLLLVQEKFGQAEPLARECLAIREREIPDDWRTFNVRSMLGGALLGQKKCADAERFLIRGYEGMKLREDKIPEAGKPRLSETLQRLVQLYEATDRLDQAAEWKKKLAGK